MGSNYLPYIRHIHKCLHPSIRLFCHLSVSQYIYLFVNTSIRLCMFVYSLCLSLTMSSVYISFCLFVSLSICLSICMSVCQYFHLSLCQYSINLSMWPSVFTCFHFIFLDCQFVHPPVCNMSKVNIFIFLFYNLNICLSADMSIREVKKTQSLC